MFIFGRLLLLLQQRTTGNTALDRLAMASQRFLQTETRSKNSTIVTAHLSCVTLKQKRFAYHLVVSTSHSSRVLRGCRVTYAGGNEEVAGERETVEGGKEREKQNKKGTQAE